MRTHRLLIAAVLLTCSSPATALQHLMSVREVYAGPADQPNAQYVLLQMYQYFQNQVSGHSVDIYDAAGTLVESYEFGQHVIFFTNQSYIWIATEEAESRFGISADLRMQPTLNLAGGMVCFETFDCLSWGNFAGASTPDGSVTPFNPTDPMAGLQPNRAVRRDASGGTDPSQLDAADDTNDCAADFDFAGRASPVNNMGDVGEDPGGGSGYGERRSGSGYVSGSLPALGLLPLALLVVARRWRQRSLAEHR